MRGEQKTLLITGAVLIVFGALYLSQASVPTTLVPAMLFPLSILGIFFGAVFILWGAGWFGLERAGFL